MGTTHSDPFSFTGIYSAQRRHQTVLTADILISHLRQSDILSSPTDPRRTFSWYGILPDTESAAGVTEADQMLLYVCRERDAEDLLTRFPSMFALVITRLEEPPSWASSFSGRCVVLHSTDRFFYTSALVQNLFTSLLVWEDELDRIVYSHSPLVQLIDEGARVLNSFICVTDVSHNLVAAPSNIPAPYPLFEDLLETGSYTPEAAAHIESTALSRDATSTVVADDAEELCGSTLMHVPICFDGSLYYLLTMVCTSGMDPRGLADLFSIFAERVVRLCRLFWDDNLKLDAPWYKVFTNFIDRVPMSVSQVNMQLERTELPWAKQLKLLCFDLGMDDSPKLRASVIDASHHINEGKCYPFAYGGMLFSLCYLTTEADAQFSSARTEADVRATVFEPYHVRAGASRIFERPEELDRAYEQTRLALNFASLQEAERELAGLPPLRCCYSFDFTVPYLTLACAYRDDELARFSLRRSLLEKLVHEDKVQGSNVVQLLWVYLCNGHNASDAAKRVNMHRNTVLYHLDKISSRFDLDLTDPFSCGKLMEDYRLYFLTGGFEHEVRFEELFDLEKRRERPLT